MADRKPFLLRLDERTFVALKRWADDDLRSVNGQVEFLLRRSLDQAGRLNTASTPAEDSSPGSAGASKTAVDKEKNDPAV